MSWFRRVLRPGRFAHTLVVGVIVFSLGATGMAFALAGIPGADNFFHGCVGSGGVFRVIPDTETCKSSEFPVLIPSKAYVDGTAGGSVAAEAAARLAADTTLQTNINNEAAARQAADTTLQNNINAEAAARAQGDADTLAAAHLYTDTSVQNEAAARQAADTTLQANINNEAAARQAADNQLQLNIDAEAAARAAADASLQSQIGSLTPAYQIVAATVLNAAPMATNDVLEVLISCPAGKVVLGGGASLETQGLALRETIPVGTTQWRARGMATKPISASSAFITAYAICANA